MCENIDQSKLKLCKVWEIRNLTGPTLRMNEKIDQNLGKDRNEKKSLMGFTTYLWSQNLIYWQNLW